MKSFKPLFLPALYQDSITQGRVILRDGSAASVRASVPADAVSVADFFRQLSPESRKRRFFSEHKPGMDMIASLCDSSNPRNQVTLLVTRVAGGAEQIIATGSYFSHGGDTAEFAVAVDDRFQGKGIGGLLLERLAVLAVSHGFLRFVAVTSPANQPMLDTFRHSGFEITEEVQDGQVQVNLAVAPRQQSVERSEMRDRVFTAASIRPFFKPNAVAVIGASRHGDGIGRRILDQLAAGGFNGPVYPVHPEAEMIGGLRAFHSVRELPGPVDLAIIAVPAASVPAVVDDCAAHGVKAVVVISAGFAETGPAGRDLQRQLVEKVRGHGMRMIGPNCLGVLNADPAVRLDGSLAPAIPEHGTIAISSQGGALGLAILGLAARLHLGLSMFASVGNKADVTGNDLLQYWEDDPGTNVILLYLESFGNPRRFARIARRVGRTKPIVCVKSGRARAPGARPAQPGSGDAATAALFRQTGVVRAATLEEMFDLAALFAHQPLPRGPRTGIVTNADGPGTLCADACADEGLETPPVATETRLQLKRAVSPAASLGNPVDLTASATPDHFALAVELALRDPRLDSVIVLCVAAAAGDDGALREGIARGVAAGRAAGAVEKPVLAVMMTEDHTNAPLKIGGETLPRYLFPESAARVLGKAVRYAQWREAPASVFPDFDDVDAHRAREVCRKAVANRGGGWLLSSEGREVLAAFKLPVPTAPGGGPEGVEVRVTVKEDAQFGPLIGFSLGGAFAYLLDDANVRITPLTLADATEMVQSIKGFSLLQGARGSKPADLEALEELLLRTSAMVEEIPEIIDVDMDPVLAQEPGQGVRIVNCRIRVSPQTAGQPFRYAMSSAPASRL